MNQEQLQQELQAKLKEGVKPSDIKKQKGFNPQFQPIKGLNNLNKKNNNTQSFDKKEEPVIINNDKKQSPFLLLGGLSLILFLLL